MTGAQRNIAKFEEALLVVDFFSFVDALACASCEREESEAWYFLKAVNPGLEERFSSFQLLLTSKPYLD